MFCVNKLKLFVELKYIAMEFLKSETYGKHKQEVLFSFSKK